MRIGFIGLGRMGKNMVFNLVEKGHEVVVFNRSPEPVKEVEKKGAIGTYSIKKLVKELPSKKVIWLMVTAGYPVDELIKKLLPYLEKGDILIDGGNSYFKDSQRRALELKKKGINFLDCGTSGGIEGARHGACMMIGGEKEVFKKVESLFRGLTVKEGYGYMGKSGSGHFVKMVHNGIEYGMMAALAEGASVLKEKGINVQNAIEVYNHGSIVESRLLSWLVKGMKKSSFKEIRGIVPLGETEKEMLKLKSMKILKEALKMRKDSRKKESYAAKLIATMRNEFGGHEFKKK